MLLVVLIWAFHTCKPEMVAEKVMSMFQLVTEIGTGMIRVTVKPPGQALETEATVEHDPGALVVTDATVVGAAVDGGTVFTVVGEGGFVVTVTVVGRTVVTGAAVEGAAVFGAVAEQTFTPLNKTLVIAGNALLEGYHTLKPTVLKTVPAFWAPL